MHFPKCLILPAMKVSQQLFKTTADVKLKDGKARIDGASDMVVVSWEEHGILMT